MRTVAFVFVAVFTAGTVAGADPKTDKALEPFQGKWEIVEATERGQSIDPTKARMFPVNFSGDQMEMIYEGEKAVKWAITVRPDKDPKEIDAALPKESEKGKVVRGIYQFDKDTLRIVLGLDKDSTRPRTFGGGGDKPTLVLVLRKGK